MLKEIRMTNGKGSPVTIKHDETAVLMCWTGIHGTEIQERYPFIKTLFSREETIQKLRNDMEKAGFLEIIENKEYGYELTPNVGKALPFTVTIVGDVNDGDYITTKRGYSKENFELKIVEQLRRLREIATIAYENDKQFYDGTEFSFEGECPDLEIPKDNYLEAECHTLIGIGVEYIDPETGLSYQVSY